MGFHRSRILIATAALAGGALASTVSPAHAETAADAAQQTVHFGDLNLASPSAVRILYARIRTAAENVCGPSLRPGSRIVSEAWKDCVSGAVHRAVVTIDSRLLTAYYFDRAHLPTRRQAG